VSLDAEPSIVATRSEPETERGDSPSRRTTRFKTGDAVHRGQRNPVAGGRRPGEGWAVRDTPHTNDAEQLVANEERGEIMRPDRRWRERRLIAGNAKNGEGGSSRGAPVRELPRLGTP
jgi:hypothetical protein